MKYGKRGLYLLILLLSPLVVYAQLTQSVLSTYDQFYGWFDFIIYMLIFTGLAREFVELKAKKESMEVGPGGQALYLGLGLLLSASLVTWEVSKGFSLKDLGPLVIVLLIIILLIRVIGYLKGGEKGKFNAPSLRSLSILLMIITAVIYLFFPGILLYYFWASWFGDLLVIVFIICFIYLIVSSAFSFGGFGGGGKGGGEEGLGGGEHAHERGKGGKWVSGEGLKDAAKSIGKWGTSPLWWPLKKLGQGAKYLGGELGIPGLKYVGKEWIGEGGKALGRGVSKIPGGVLKAGERVAGEIKEKSEAGKEKQRQWIAARADALRNSTLNIICLSKQKGTAIPTDSPVIFGDVLTFNAQLESIVDIKELNILWELNKVKSRWFRRDMVKITGMGKEQSVAMNTKNLNLGSHLVNLTITDKSTGITRAKEFVFNLAKKLEEEDEEKKEEELPEIIIAPFRTKVKKGENVKINISFKNVDENNIEISWQLDNEDKDAYKNRRGINIDTINLTEGEHTVIIDLYEKIKNRHKIKTQKFIVIGETENEIEIIVYTPYTTGKAKPIGEYKDGEQIVLEEDTLYLIKTNSIKGKFNFKDYKLIFDNEEIKQNEKDLTVSMLKTKSQKEAKLIAYLKNKPISVFKIKIAEKSLKEMEEKDPRFKKFIEELYNGLSKESNYIKAVYSRINSDKGLKNKNEYIENLKELHNFEQKIENGLLEFERNLGSYNLKESEKIKIINNLNNIKTKKGTFKKYSYFIGNAIEFLNREDIKNTLVALNASKKDFEDRLNAFKHIMALT